MIKAIPMEDWLRGCIYHDGRHGYVTLPIDKVHQIANYIQRTRRSTTDGLIDLEVVEADRKTENCSEKPNNCEECEHWNDTEDGCADRHGCKTEPQTYVINPQEPTNDEKCFECDDFFICGGQCNKIKDEPQTNKDFKVTYTCSFTECDNFKNFGFGEKCIECKRKQSEAKHKDEPQTDCAWK